MKRRQHEVTGQGGLDGDFRGFQIANLTHQHHVGVLSENRSQRGCEGETGLFVHLDLDDAGQPVLDGILHRDDVDTLGLNVPDGRIQGGSLSGPGRPGY